MFTLTKVAETVLLPPGIILLFGVAAALLALFKLRKTALFISAIAFIGLYLLSIGPVADALLGSLETEYPPLSAAASGADDLVILGGGTVAGAPDAQALSQGTAAQPASVPASLGAESAVRVLYGFRIAKATDLPVIISGGSPLKTAGTESEAAAARQLLVSLGLQQSKIHIETSSRTTWENAINVHRLFNPRTIILVTSAYHMPRAVFCFRKQGIAVIPAPTGYQIDRPALSSFFRFLPDISALRDSTIAIKERAGLFVYRVLHGGLPRKSS